MTAARRFGLISDTHGHKHPDIFRHFAGVEAILHAGDVCGEDVLIDLGCIAPVYAVCGNCDFLAPEMAVRRVVELPFGLVGISHGHLYNASVPRRIVELVSVFRAPRLRLVLTGHSHVALEEVVDGVLVVNPGAACPPRLGADSSIAVLEWSEAEDTLRVVRHELAWPPRGGR